MKRWHIHRLDRTLGEHAPAWDALRRRLLSDNPMLDSCFVDALLRHFGSGKERLCVFEEGGLVVAMCLICPITPGVWATFLPSQAQIGPALLTRPEIVGQLMRALPGLAGQIDFLCNDPAFGDLSAARDFGGGFRDHALTMSISLVGDFTMYWSNRSKKLVQNIGRYERRLAADNIEVKMVCITSSAEIDSAVMRYAALEASGWKGKLGTAVAPENVQGNFYREIEMQFARAKQACVYELWFGDQLAASRLSVATDGTIVMLKTTYDESLNKYAPGRLLLRRVIEKAFVDHRGGVIEFYTDANADQLAWATDQRWIRHVSFYRGPITSNLFTILRAGRQILNPIAISNIAAASANHPDRIDVYSHPKEFPGDVQQLFVEAETVSVEFGMPWYRNLVDNVYEHHAGVRFYVLRQSERPVAVLPVLVQKNLLGHRVESLANYYSAIYAPIILPEVKAVDLVPLVQAVSGAHEPLGSFRFAPMDPHSLTYRRLQNGLKAAGLAPFEFYCFGNWYLTVQGDWPGYLASRDGTLRNTIKRMGKKFSHEGGTLELITSEPDVERGLAAYQRVYAASWKSAEPFEGFIPGLVRTCATLGWLRMGVAWLQGRPIAAQIWIVANDKASIYKLAFDEGFASYAPGTLLTARLTQHVMEQDHVAEIDYLIGDDPYKMSWMNQRRERWGLVAYNPRTIRGAIGLIREFVGRAAKLVVYRTKKWVSRFKSVMGIDGIPKI